MGKEIAEAAERLSQAFKEGGTCAPVHDLIGKDDLAKAYEVQEKVVEFRRANGAKIVGRKVGFTSTAIQERFGVSQPGYGFLFDDMDCSLGGVCNSDPRFYSQQPRIEAEIAFVLSRDIAFENPTTSQIIDAVAYAVPALEIVASRVAGPDVCITDIIADNTYGGYFVLGHQPRLLRDVNVVDCKMTLVKKTMQGGKEISENVSEGTGAMCYGSPLNALRWLAREMVRIERPLQEGDVVMSGALGSMIPVDAGSSFEGRIEGWGSVSALFP